MCFDTDSTPPIFDQPICASTATPLQLVSADDTHFETFLAQPSVPSGAGIVILPDMRGLSNFYEQLAIRLAEQGHAALAIDYFGRTAGTGPRQQDFPFLQHIMQVTAKTIGEDIAAAIEYLRTLGGGNCHSVMALGFCFGGRQAFLASAPRFNLAGAIGFYGALSFYPNGAPGPLQRVGKLRAPILGIFGGADTGIPSSDVTAFESALTAAHVEHEIITYPGAPHSFFDIKYREHASACVDAWQRVLTFISAHATPQN